MPFGKFQQQVCLGQISLNNVSLTTSALHEGILSSKTLPEAEAWTETENSRFRLFRRASSFLLDSQLKPCWAATVAMPTISPATFHNFLSQNFWPEIEETSSSDFSQSLVRPLRFQSNFRTGSWRPTDGKRLRPIAPAVASRHPLGHSECCPPKHHHLLLDRGPEFGKWRRAVGSGHPRSSLARRDGSHACPNSQNSNKNIAPDLRPMSELR